MINFAATRSFIFLGCIQIIIVYTLASFAQTFKIFLAYWGTDTMKDFIPSFGTMASNLKLVALLAKFNPKLTSKTHLHPYTNFMIAFVVCVQHNNQESNIDDSFSHLYILYLCFSSHAIDIDKGAQNKCMAADCPLGGTLGLWRCYIVGIFMA